MNRVIAVFLLILIAFVLIPYLMTLGIDSYSQPQDMNDINIEEIPSIKVYTSDNKETDIPLDEYLCGAVAFQMPLNYEDEAIKAQSICIYTYYLYKLKNNTPDEKHPSCPVCADSSHCRGYRSKEELKTELGEAKFNKEYPRLQNLIRQVLYEAILFDSEPINAVFHAISSGRTESAADVWGQDIQYLRSVDSNVDTSARDYLTTVIIPAETFKNKFKNANDKMNFSSNADSWIEDILLTDAGGIKSVRVGGVLISGNEFRKTLSLRSTNIVYILEDNEFTFNIKGYGHCVGLSQYGANKYAEQGMKYSDILKKYYSGVEIKQVKP